jgi:predicted permease
MVLECVIVMLSLLFAAFLKFLILKAFVKYFSFEMKTGPNKTLVTAQLSNKDRTKTLSRIVQDYTNSCCL